jgi:hypothetical protein
MAAEFGLDRVLARLDVSAACFDATSFVRQLAT